MIMLISFSLVNGESGINFIPDFFLESTVKFTFLGAVK